MAAEVSIRRGHIYWVDWSPSRGSEMAGRRPALIVQRDAGNLAVTYPNTVVVAIGSQGHEIPLHVKIAPTKANGLKNVSWVKCEQIFTVAKERLGARLGSLSAQELRDVDTALRLNLKLEASES